MLVLIALRNLFRNQRRTALSLMIVSVGTVTLLLTVGFVRNSFDGLRDAVIQGGLGHLEVAPEPEPGAEMSSEDRSGHAPEFRDWRAVRDTIERQAGVRAAGATIQFAGVATNGTRSASFIAVAVEPDRERRMGFDVKLRAGANLTDREPLAGDDRLLLGSGLVRALGAAPGDSVTIMAATPDGALNAVDMIVDGVFTTGLQELDSRIVKMHVSTAQRLLGTDFITSLIVSLNDAGAAGRVEAELRQRLAGNKPPLTITGWEARAPYYTQVRSLYAGIFVFLGTIVALFVALSTSNTMLMSVLERVREMGTLLAIGTSRAQLARLLTFEAFWLALFGGIAGSALGLSLVGVINALRIDMPPPPGAVDPIPLKLTVIPSDLVWIGGFMTIALVGAAIPPMVRVFRLRIIDALGHV
jgi:putative ABC transport system permease protein